MSKANSIENSRVQNLDVKKKKDIILDSKSKSSNLLENLEKKLEEKKQETKGKDETKSLGKEKELNISDKNKTDLSSQEKNLEDKADFSVDTNSLERNESKKESSVRKLFIGLENTLENSREETDSLETTLGETVPLNNMNKRDNKYLDKSYNTNDEKDPYKQNPVYNEEKISTRYNLSSSPNFDILKIRDHIPGINSQRNNFTQSTEIQPISERKEMYKLTSQEFYSKEVSRSEFMNRNLSIKGITEQEEYYK